MVPARARRYSPPKRPESWPRKDSTRSILCYNKPLQEYLAATLKDTGVRVQTFHGLVFHQCLMAGIPIPQNEERTLEWYVTEAPLLLARAARVNGDRFSALIIDETQDFPRPLGRGFHAGAEASRGPAARVPSYD